MAHMSIRLQERSRYGEMLLGLDDADHAVSLHCSSQSIESAFRQLISSLL